MREADESTPIHDESRRICIEACKNLSNAIQNLDLKASERALSRLAGNLQDNHKFSLGDFKAYSEDFILRLDELSLTKFLLIDAAKINFYEQKTTRRQRRR